MKLAAVVLAAGKSERMGRNKLLLQIAGRTLLDLNLHELSKSSVDEVYVVLGHQPEDLRPVVRAHRAKEVLNPRYEEGMASSFQAALRKVKAEATFLVLGDQVGLEVDLLERMSEAMASDPTSLLVSPVYRGQKGHPVLIRRTLFPEILSLKKEETLRQVLSRHEESHRLVEGSVWCIMDIDTPQEFQEAKKLLEAKLCDETR